SASRAPARSRSIRRTPASSRRASCSRCRCRTTTASSTAPTASASCAGCAKRWNNPSCFRCKGEQRGLMTSTQLVVIGGGPGGYAAAFLAADLGLSTVLVDPEVNPGGVCVYRGCIPSKALLHVAKLVDEARHAKAWGISYNEPSIDLDKLR